MTPLLQYYKKKCSWNENLSYGWPSKLSWAGKISISIYHQESPYQLCVRKVSLNREEKESSRTGSVTGISMERSRVKGYVRQSPCGDGIQGKRNVLDHVDYPQIIFSWIKLVSYRSQNQEQSKWHSTECTDQSTFSF